MVVKATNITPSTFASRIRIQYRMKNGVNNKNSNENRHYNDKINTGMLNVTDNWQLPIEIVTIMMIMKMTVIATVTMMMMMMTVTMMMMMMMTMNLLNYSNSQRKRKVVRKSYNSKNKHEGKRN